MVDVESVRLPPAVLSPTLSCPSPTSFPTQPLTTLLTMPQPPSQALQTILALELQHVSVHLAGLDLTVF